MGRRSINALMEGLKVIPPPGVGLPGGGIFFVSGGRTRLSKHSEVEEGNGVFQPVLLVLDGWHLPGGYTGRNADVPFSNARRESPCGLRRVGGGVIRMFCGLGKVCLQEVAKDVFGGD